MSNLVGKLATAGLRSPRWGDHPNDRVAGKDWTRRPLLGSAGRADECIATLGRVPASPLGGFGGFGGLSGPGVVPEPSRSGPERPRWPMPARLDELRPVWGPIGPSWRAGRGPTSSVTSNRPCRWLGDILGRSAGPDTSRRGTPKYLSDTSDDDLGLFCTSRRWVPPNPPIYLCGPVDLFEGVAGAHPPPSGLSHRSSPCDPASGGSTHSGYGRSENSIGSITGVSTSTNCSPAPGGTSPCSGFVCIRPCGRRQPVIDP